ncbi:MAG: ABC transporter permease [Ilumatobacteraceae bacterium]|nr:ABC transporter permease [Ilumatobacteraceae bacterium]
MTATIALAGTVPLARIRVRIDRVRLALWTAGLVVMVGASAASIDRLFPTQADLDQAAAGSDNPAIRAFNGPAQALDTLGGQVAFQIGAPGFVIAALASILLTTRLTRREEESGRLELVRALPVGRGSSMAAAAGVLGLMNVVVGLGVALVCLASGLPAAGCWAFGLEFTTVGWVFTAVALVAAQLASTSRAASGLAGAVLALSFVLRAIGDMTNGVLSWLSPIGWAQAARPWAGERWWVFILPIAATIALGALARALLVRRDLGGGLLPARRGPAVAAPRLATPLALAIRQQRAVVIGWGAALALFGFVYGVVVDSIEDFVSDNESMTDFMAAGGGGASLTDSYLAQSIRVLALIASGFTAQAVLRARGEETSGRAEPLLALPVTRRSWLGSHAGIAAVGSIVVTLAAAVAMAVGVLIATGDPDQVAGLFGAALGYTPALMVVVGAGLALSGWLPRAAVATWALVAAGMVIGVFGPVLDLPDWVSNLSPFEHIALAPAEATSFVPLVVLSVVAAVLAVVGFAGIDRRDVPS